MTLLDGFNLFGRLAFAGLVFFASVALASLISRAFGRKP